MATGESVRNNNIKWIHCFYLVSLFSLSQNIHDSVDIHRESFHRRRISGRLRVHARGKMSAQIKSVAEKKGSQQQDSLLSLL